MKPVKKIAKQQSDISVVGISNMMEEVTRKMAQDINKKKELVICQKLKEIVGIEIDVIEEGIRRFKRLSIEYKGNEQTIYFNDGSLKGIRIVTFVKKEVPFDFETFSLGYEETYY
jgi:hypothetical protein